MKTVNWISNKNIDVKIIDEFLKLSINNNQFTNYGPNVKYLEKYLKEILEIENNKSIICVANASLGIQCLASAIELKENKKIKWATQSFTFPPSCQGTLKDTKIIDIDKEGGLDLKKVGKNINGIIITNIFGNVVNIDKYINWAKLNNKYLIFDNAATSYTFYKGKNVINYGIGSIISFHHTKPFGFGEGGAIIIDNKYENEVRKLTNFGINYNDDEYFLREGNNYKMSDISAVYIIQYLKNNYKNIIEKHINLYNYFKEKSKNNKKYKLFISFNDKKIVISCFCIVFKKYNDNIRLKLMENNIFCRKYYFPLKKTKNSINIFNNILCIPCNIDMKNSDIDRIIELIK